ncbi:hypothetical protein BN1723_018104 [Verticillium longisporum]|nr:hypothetical protein BN1723_018104 [Verticillium longisporum]
MDHLMKLAVSGTN